MADKANKSQTKQSRDEAMLRILQRETFNYFLDQNPSTGLVPDNTDGQNCSSIGATGMAITVYLIGIERGFLSREESASRILKVLRFLMNAPQTAQEDAAGFNGFFYHFLNLDTGTRYSSCELSTIDTAFFIAGALSAAGYFDSEKEDEKEIRQIVKKLYERVDWQWAMNHGETIVQGWTPEKGFFDLRWDKDYNESIILYVLALGSPTKAIPGKAYKTWTKTFRLTKIYGIEYLYAGPLFIHQFSHLWIDFRGIKDDFNTKTGFDYFENSRRATHVHQLYGIANPKKFKHYGKNSWGLTASDGPGDKTIKVDGREIQFYGYLARGAPFGPDDGTVSPCAVVASLPFAPDIVIETIRNFIGEYGLKRENLYGLDSSFNFTFPDKKNNPLGWVSDYKFGLNQASVIMMIENYYSGFVWKLMSASPYIQYGLKSAGFSGGWLAK